MLPSRWKSSVELAGCGVRCKTPMKARSVRNSPSSIVTALRIHSTSKRHARRALTSSHIMILIMIRWNHAATASLENSACSSHDHRSVQTHAASSIKTTRTSRAWAY
eukprot:1096620-Rhodomonas_salina.3